MNGFSTISPLAFRWLVVSLPVLGLLVSACEGADDQHSSTVPDAATTDLDASADADSALMDTDSDARRDATSPTWIRG